MDNFDMAMALIKEAQEEKRKLEAYLNERSKTDRWDDSAWDAFFRKWRKEPHRSVVNDNLKLARRLLLKEYM